MTSESYPIVLHCQFIDLHCLLIVLRKALIDDELRQKTLSKFFGDRYRAGMGKRKSGAETADGRNLVVVPLNPDANRVVNDWCDRTVGSKTVAEAVDFVS